MGKTYLAKCRRSLSVSGPAIPRFHSSGPAPMHAPPLCRPPAPIRVVTPNHSNLQSACQVCGPPSSDPCHRPASRPPAPIRDPRASRAPSSDPLATHPVLRTPGSDPRATQPARRVPFFQVWRQIFGTSPWSMGSIKDTPEGAYEVTTHSWSWCQRRTPAKPPPHFYPSRALPQPFTSIMYSQDSASHYER